MRTVFLLMALILGWSGAGVAQQPTVEPRSMGGETSFENLCLACPTCNRYKANRTTAIDPQEKDEIPLFHPHRDRWTAHFAWNHDATEMVGLTATGRATISARRMNRPQLICVRRMWVTMGEHPPHT